MVKILISWSAFGWQKLFNKFYSKLKNFVTKLLSEEVYYNNKIIKSNITDYVFRFQQT